jgi:carbamoyl-phosphate synthase large subunit
MGIATTFPAAFAKAQLGASVRLPYSGRAFISVRDADKDRMVALAEMLVKSGFEVLATNGTHKFLSEAGVTSTQVAKVTDGVRPHVVDRLLSDEVAFIVNTTEGAQAIKDSKSISQAALDRGIVYFTTMAGGLAAAEAIASKSDVTDVTSIQDYHKEGN